MVYRSEIEKALDEMIADEAGMKFQGLAVVLAKQKWPQLVACERKWDKGLDAHANGGLEPGGNGIGLACSLTATLDKIASDAAEVKKNYPDVRILIFATAGKATNHTTGQWAEEIRKNFGFELIVVSREELVTSLLDPANADACRAQLGIPVAMAPELEPAVRRSLAAAAEVADDWQRHALRAGRPLIDLEAEKYNAKQDRAEILTIVNIRELLAAGRRMILEAPAGRGKTITLVQLAKRDIAEGRLASLVDLPTWVKSGKSILQFIAEQPQFVSRGVDVNALSKLRGSQPLSFLLNGWNEVSAATAEAAVLSLRELERNFPSAGIIVATRTHHLTPPLPGAFRAQLRSLSRTQRDRYLELALGPSARDLRVKLDNSRMLYELTRTPLILAEVVDLFRSGTEIPTTKIGVLGAVMHVLEHAQEHHTYLQQAPLGGYAAEYLRALAMAMTEQDDIEIGEGNARAVVTSVSAMLLKAGQIVSQPEPADVLNELVKHHILERFEHPGVVFRFQHQQFQEFFAAGGLKGRLLDVVRANAAAEERSFLKRYVNEPRWGESLRMLAEDIGATSGEKGIVEAGAKLVRMALAVDPIFAGELTRWCGPKVWSEIREEIGGLRAWYAQPDRNHQQCALAAMLATGAGDFADIVVPLLSASDNQVRLVVYHSGVEFCPSSLGPNWSETIRAWPEEARLDFILELAHDPWLSEIVERIALQDPSPKIKWNAARMLSWYGFTEKVERLLKSVDEGSLREFLRAAHPEEVPDSERPRVVGVYEQMCKEAADPFERLRLLRGLQTFGGSNTVERMKIELDGLGPGQLKPGENQGQIRWALDELQKSDPEWVSEWATRKVLDKSIWFGAWRGLITQMPNEKREALYSRFSTEALDQREQQRVLPVLVSVMDAAFAARVFVRACEIRTGLSFAPGEDQTKWNLFRQVEDLLRAISPAMLLDGISDKLEKEPEVLELDILTDTLPATNLTKPDVRSSVGEEMRRKLRGYLKRGAKLGADPDGLRANTRAHLALLLANVGEREDLADIRLLIEADSIRFQRAQEARAKGDRSQDTMGYGFLYFDTVTMVDPAAADEVLVELVRTQQYEHVLSQRLPWLAQKKTNQLGFGTDRMDFKKIWKSRAGEPDESFVEERRLRFADTIREEIARIQKERVAATDKRGFDHRLKMWGGALAAIDGKRSATLILELMERPGRWDGWTRVGALENLLVWGVGLSLEQVLGILDPTMEELREGGLHDQNLWLFARCLCVMAFVDQPAAGIAKIREILGALRFPRYEFGSVVSALGASRCDDAVDVLMEFAGVDGIGVDAVGESWIEAIGALEGARSSEILLSFVDPNAKMFNREFIPDHRHGDLVARLLAERAAKDRALKRKLVELANGDLPRTKRMLLAKVFGQITSEDDLVEGLCVLRDDGSGVPYEVVRSMENVFLERRPYGPSGSAYTLSPLGCNRIRKRLFEMVIGDPHRRASAFALLGQIEVWRLEHGHPSDEPRHPAVDSDVPWPPLIS